MQLESVWLRFSANFHNRFVGFQTINNCVVTFSHNRLPTRRMHQALELAHTRGMSSLLLFPPPTPVAPAIQVMKITLTHTHTHAHVTCSRKRLQARRMHHALEIGTHVSCLCCCYAHMCHVFVVAMCSLPCVPAYVLLLTHCSASNGDSIQSPTERAADAGGAAHTRASPSLPLRHLRPSWYDDSFFLLLYFSFSCSRVSRIKRIDLLASMGFFAQCYLFACVAFLTCNC